MTNPTPTIHPAATPDLEAHGNRYLGVSDDVARTTGWTALDALPAFAWPGGYDVAYLDAEGAVLCATCANDVLDQNAEAAISEGEGVNIPTGADRIVAAWAVEGSHEFDEGETCEDCGRLLPSE